MLIPPWWLSSERVFSWQSHLGLTRKSITCFLEIPSCFHVVDGRLDQSIRVFSVFFLLFTKTSLCQMRFLSRPNSTMMAPLIYPLIPNESRQGVKPCFALGGDTQNMSCSAAGMWMECGAFCVQMWHLRWQGGTIEQVAPPSDPWAVCFSWELFFCHGVLHKRSCSYVPGHKGLQLWPRSRMCKGLQATCTTYLFFFFNNLLCGHSGFGTVKPKAIGAHVA